MERRGGLESARGLKLINTAFHVKDGSVLFYVNMNSCFSKWGLEMTRRQGYPLFGARYCANTSPSKKEVHDLDNETAQCQIDKIIAAGHARLYQTLAAAHKDGYGDCHCLSTVLDAKDTRQA